MRVLNYLILYSKSHCRWTGVIDFDEYITPAGAMAETAILPVDGVLHQSPTLGSDRQNSSSIAMPLKGKLPPLIDHIANSNPHSWKVWSMFSNYLIQQLEQHDPPILKLQWMLMSSHDHVRRPAGLLIENYFDGAMNLHLRAFARSDIILAWKISHSLTKFINQDKYPDAESYYTNFRLPSYEYETTPLPNGCRIPNSGWFVRHYFFRSFEEYSANRARRKRMSDGMPSNYENNISFWRKNSQFNSPCDGISRNFTLHMAKLVRRQLVVRAQELWIKLERVSPMRARIISPKTIFDSFLSGSYSLRLRRAFQFLGPALEPLLDVHSMLN
jgi:hypothetical protein